MRLRESIFVPTTGKSFALSCANICRCAVWSSSDRARHGRRRSTPTSIWRFSTTSPFRSMPPPPWPRASGSLTFLSGSTWSCGPTSTITCEASSAGMPLTCRHPRQVRLPHPARRRLLTACTSRRGIGESSKPCSASTCRMSRCGPTAVGPTEGATPGAIWTLSCGGRGWRRFRLSRLPTLRTPCASPPFRFSSRRGIGGRCRHSSG